MMDNDKKLPPSTAAFQNKVLPSSTLGDTDSAVGTPPPKEGVGLTSMTPIASRRMPGNSSPDWPANRSSFTYYGGKGPR